MSDHTTRRQFIGAAGALTVTALAGCTDSGSDGSEGDGGGTTDSSTADGTGESSMDGGDDTMDGGDDTMDDGDDTMDGGDNSTMDGGDNSTMDG